MMSSNEKLNNERTASPVAKDLSKIQTERDKINTKKDQKKNKINVNNKKSYAYSFGNLVKYLAPSTSTSFDVVSSPEPRSNKEKTPETIEMKDNIDIIKIPIDSINHTLHQDSINNSQIDHSPILKTKPIENILLRKGSSDIPKIWSPGTDETNLKDTETKRISSLLSSEFALILEDHTFDEPMNDTNENIEFSNMLSQQCEIINKCIKAGLHISVLSSTKYNRNVMCFLLKPTKKRMKVEQNRLVLERWLQIGAIGEVPHEIEQLIAHSIIGNNLNNEKNDCNEEELKNEEDEMDLTKYTPADQLQIIGRIISSTSDINILNPPGAGISLEDNNKELPIIRSCFPLHNRQVNKNLLSRIHHLWWWWKTEDVIHDLRFYFGEKVALSFAFLFFYTKWLFMPGCIGTILYLLLRFYNSIDYMRALAIFGFIIPTVWGTLFLKFWRRENEKIKDLWNIRLFKEAEYANIYFKPHGYRDIVDNRGILLFQEPYYNPIYRIPSYIQTFTVFSIFIATYVIGITFFVQWYTAAMLAPVCTDCPECKGFLSCFETQRPILFTSRWLYILIQGIFLGIILDIFVYLLSIKLIHFFVNKENHETEEQIQRVIINRIFLINWISFFLWFILIAFVIVPFGEIIETKISDKFHFKKFTVDWKNGRIDMSTALVTPLLITQGLNLLIDSILPYLLSRRLSNDIKKRENIYKNKMASKYNNRLETIHLDETKEKEIENQHYKIENDRISKVNESTKDQNVYESSIKSNDEEFQSKYDMEMMTPPNIPLIEKRLNISIPTIDFIENNGYMISDDIIKESKLPLYINFTDYLKMVIQFGYVVMFTVVWPFCPLAAFLNNLFHIRNSFNRLLINRRRPIPRKSNHIGQWEKTLWITLILSLFIMMGLICISSGQLEYFIPTCLNTSRFNGTDYSMTPDFSCFSISNRFTIGLVLEHGAFIIVYLLYDNISSVPSYVKKSFQRKKAIIKRAIRGQKNINTKNPIDSM